MTLETQKSPRGTSNLARFTLPEADIAIASLSGGAVSSPEYSYGDTQGTLLERVALARDKMFVLVVQQALGATLSNEGLAIRCLMDDHPEDERPDRIRDLGRRLLGDAADKQQVAVIIGDMGLEVLETALYRSKFADEADLMLSTEDVMADDELPADLRQAEVARIGDVAHRHALRRVMSRDLYSWLEADSLMQFNGLN